MSLRGVLSKVGLATMILGVGAGLTIFAAGCGEGQVTDTDPVDPKDGQAMTQPQLPPIDVEAPIEFQTATFAYG